jgi:succinyl-CoA synthetase beta subunit
VPAPRRLVASDPADLPGALGEAGLGETLVVKADCLGAVHKADAGALRVGVPAAEAGRAAEAVWAAAREAFGPGRVAGVIVEELVEPVAELLVSVHRDPHVGPVVTVGAGGALVEAMADAASRLAPVGVAEATRMIDELRVAALLDGRRGRRGADRDALARAVAAVSELGPLLGDGVGLVEVNPLAALPDGVRALDAVVEGPP